jgi:hypothetical protein
LRSSSSVQFPGGGTAADRTGESSAAGRLLSPVLPYGSHTRSSAVATVETPGSVRNAASSPDRSTARAFSERVRLTARRRDNRDVLFAPGRIRSYGTGARTHASTFFFYETLLDTCGVSTCAGLVYAGERKLVKIYCMPTRPRERMMTCRASRSLLGRIWTRPDLLLPTPQPLDQCKPSQQVTPSIDGSALLPLCPSDWSHYYYHNTAFAATCLMCGVAYRSGTAFFACSLSS